MKRKYNGIILGKTFSIFSYRVYAISRAKEQGIKMGLVRALLP
tara:strand:+ start:15349 stop:15477 length:129 start_codon:yes stop_codon:yes gene_type:complete